MTNAAHTPGPWFYEESTSSDNTFSIRDDAETPIADVERWNGDNDLEVMAEAEANARLIAAAPKLLEVLQDFLEDDMKGMMDCEIAEIEPDSLYGRALAAIAAATGGRP
jgi:hypothetical protein